MVNLTESVRQWVLKNLPYDRRDAPLVAYLNGLNAHGLLVVYHNWMNRLVKPQPRVVHKSKAFQQNPLATQRANDLAQIIADIGQGRDLKKYLSREIVRAPAKASGAAKRPDLDLMLNDWAFTISTSRRSSRLMVLSNATALYYSSVSNPTLPT